MKIRFGVALDRASVSVDGDFHQSRFRNVGEGGPQCVVERVDAVDGGGFDALAACQRTKIDIG